MLTMLFKRLRMADSCPVRIGYAGRRARMLGRVLKGVLLILLTAAGVSSGLPSLHIAAGAVGDQNSLGASITNDGYTGPVPIRQQEADPVPKLSPPKTALPSANDLLGSA